MEEKENIKVATEKLFADYSFNPTNKSEWVNKLIEGGLNEEEARHVFKVVATRYYVKHNQYNGQRNKKDSLAEKAGKVGLGIGVGFLTFWLGPLLYLILVLIVIAILGFIFKF